MGYISILGSDEFQWCGWLPLFVEGLDGPCFSGHCDLYAAESGRCASPAPWIMAKSTAAMDNSASVHPLVDDVKIVFSNFPTFWNAILGSGRPKRCTVKARNF